MRRYVQRARAAVGRREGGSQHDRAGIVLQDADGGQSGRMLARRPAGAKARRGTSGPPPSARRPRPRGPCRASTTISRSFATTASPWNRWVRLSSGTASSRISTQCRVATTARPRASRVEQGGARRGGLGPGRPAGVHGGRQEDEQQGRMRSIAASPHRNRNAWGCRPMLRIGALATDPTNLTGSIAGTTSNPGSCPSRLR